MADSVEAQAAHNMQTGKEVAFLKKKAAIISKLFLSSDIPPRLRVRCWDPPRKDEGCTATSGCRERGTRQRSGSAAAKHAVKLQSMLWSLGLPLRLHGMGLDPAPDPC